MRMYVPITGEYSSLVICSIFSLIFGVINLVPLPHHVFFFGGGGVGLGWKGSIMMTLVSFV